MSSVKILTEENGLRFKGPYHRRQLHKFCMEASTKTLTTSITTAMEEAYDVSTSRVKCGDGPRLRCVCQDNLKSNGRKANKNEKGSGAVYGDGNAKLDVTRPRPVTAVARPMSISQSRVKPSV